MVLEGTDLSGGAVSIVVKCKGLCATLRTAYCII